MSQTNFAEKLFNALDINKDNSISLKQISLKEIEAALEVIKEIEKIAGENNEITLKELIDQSPEEVNNDNDLKKIFNLIDENQNNKLTKTEIETFKKNLINFKDNFSKIDKDKSAEISLDDLKSFIEKNESCIEIDNSELVRNPEEKEHVLS